MRRELLATAVLVFLAAFPAVAGEKPHYGQGKAWFGQEKSLQPGKKAVARMVGQDGKDVGSATLTETAEGLVVKLDLKNVPPGVHGLHIHEMGECTPPDFRSAGEHLSLSGQKHGFPGVDNSHIGDLPSVTADRKGRVKQEIKASHVKFTNGPVDFLSDTGTALILHEKEDDYQKQPAGGTGSRIACGVISRDVR
ncbi:MAG: superoxide dismutase family protein [Pseudomonadota bacterium]|nr:superoxide dismutase family protein [Pseudomonadota bacterium]